MRNFLLVLSIVVTGLSCKPDKDAFIIQGKVEGLNVPYVYLIHPEESGEKLDTLEVKNGTFRIKGTIENPNVYLLAFGEEYRPLEIFLEPGKFEVIGSLKDFNTLKVNGGALQSSYNDYIDEVIPFNDAYSAVYEQFVEAKQNGDTELMETLTSELDSIKDVYYEQSYSFIEKTPVSILSAKLIAEVLMANPDLDRLQPIVSKFDEHVRKTSFGQRIINTLTVMQKTLVGTDAPLFTMSDIEGNEIALEQYRGKYVLVDFWASWCGPCRDENPRLVSVYKKYKGPKFDILGVSIDQNKNKWRQAVEEDKLSWTQVVDENNISNNTYGIISIPSNVLLDPEGKIVAKNIFGKKLEGKLNEVLGKTTL